VKVKNPKAPAVNGAFGRQERQGIIEPCLPSPTMVPPSGSGWLHKIKHDGFRILARKAKLLTQAPVRRHPSRPA